MAQSGGGGKEKQRVHMESASMRMTASGERFAVLKWRSDTGALVPLMGIHQARLFNISGRNSPAGDTVEVTVAATGSLGSTETAFREGTDFLARRA